jgi:xanthine/CO dehydrogenase XdhC/CoxF family maturation factor
MEDVARRLLVIVAALLLSYLVVPYLIMPAVWKCYARRHSSFDDVPGVTHTASGVPGGTPEPMNDAALPKSFKPDSWTAAVLTFHDHDWEPALLKGLLATPCFYIGAIGSHVVHARRLESLAAMSLADRDLARIRGSIGLVPGAKSCASLAVGVVAEIMAEAKARNFMM